MLLDLFEGPILVLGLGTIFISGVILIISGVSKKDKKKRRRGLIYAGIPMGLVVVVFLYELFFSIFAIKPPNQKDLIGIYHITKATNDLDKSTFRNYRLEFRKDSTFSLTATPSIEVCDSGRYEIDYEFEYNELAFRCPPNTVTSAHIERRIGSYRIEFIIGDPDMGESIYFEKDK